MSRSSKKQFKQYPITTIEDALSILGALITDVMVHLEKYQKYKIELQNIIVEYSELEPNTKEIISSRPVPEDVFCNLDDKVKYRQSCMLKVLADEQKTSFSYIMLRRIIERLSFIKDALPEKVNSILNDFLQVRNWSFHNPQSLYNAQKETVQKTTPKELRSYIKPQLNPVIAFVNDFYDITYLLSLDIHMTRRIEQTFLVLEHMKKDYVKMYKDSNMPIRMTVFDGKLVDTKDVQFIIHKIKKPKELLDLHDSVLQVSMGIQKGKYDGSKEAFEEWTMSKVDK